MKRIAFYAPIKPPDHPIPSGDRLIAGNLMTALTGAGFAPFLVSRFIAYSKREAEDTLHQRRAEAMAEAVRIIDELKADPPDLLLTYHPYCKAPDWIGPRVSAALSIPYVTVEAARTGQGFENGGDRWAAWRAEAQEGIRAADLHICLKPTDRAYLTDLLGGDERLAMLRPFFDATVPQVLPEISLPGHWRGDVPVLVTVGMMRPGKKVENFRQLSEALAPLEGLPWNLVVIGGGPEEGTVRGFFSRFRADRLHFTGGIEREAVLAHMAAADLFVWPGWKEPIGMVYLEAHMMGLPVAALDDMGVPLVVAHGETGLLGGDVAALSDNIATMISQPSLRADFAANASRHAVERHGMDQAATRLRTLLDPLMKAR